MSSDQPRRGIDPRPEDEPLVDGGPTADAPPQRSAPLFRDEPPAAATPPTPQRAAFLPPEAPAAEPVPAAPQRAASPPEPEPNAAAAHWASFPPRVEPEPAAAAAQRASFPPPVEPSRLPASPHPAASPTVDEPALPPVTATPTYSPPAPPAHPVPSTPTPVYEPAPMLDDSPTRVIPTPLYEPAPILDEAPPRVTQSPVNEPAPVLDQAPTHVTPAPTFESWPPLDDAPTRVSPTPLYRPAAGEPDAPVAASPLAADLASHPDDPTHTIPRHSAEPVAQLPPEPSHSFSNALGWTIVGTMFPGVGLVRGGSRFSGIAALVIFVASLGGLGYLAYEGHLAARLITNPIALIIGATLCGVFAILMTGLVVATYLALRPSAVTVIQRIIGALLVGVLCFAVTAPLAVVATAGYAQAKLVTLLFRPTESQTRPTIAAGTASDPWANTPRINVLLVGGDAGGTTDTMIVASIDTKTGNTILITVPRDTARLPFPTSSPLRTYFPNGYWDGANGEAPASWADRLWTDLPTKVPANALGATSNLSADALKLGIGEALGLRVDYYLYLDAASLYTLVDALGGVTMNVATRVPTDSTATSWIEPGAGRHLDAYQALWYGWSSSGTDAQRQTRRTCLVDAMTSANPAMVLARFDSIVQAGTAATTDIPSSMLPMMVELGTRVKRSHVTSLEFANGVDGFVSASPNFPLMRQRVASAVAGSLDPTSAKTSTAVSIATQCGS